ncbi:hypothetical protein PR048_033200 [Dryococelus australis]|uniref:Uncharacterized protein n=1 Tax=Dryococelus australis TaxID=614101 RepID=A0ABQ9FZK7_9NEOP|nr:hypothetical protein PR048_033200 [Dryococelus australis]
MQSIGDTLIPIVVGGVPQTTNEDRAMPRSGTQTRPARGEKARIQVAINPVAVQRSMACGTSSTGQCITASAYKTSKRHNRCSKFALPIHSEALFRTSDTYSMHGAWPPDESVAIGMSHLDQIHVVRFVPANHETSSICIKAMPRRLMPYFSLWQSTEQAVKVRRLKQTGFLPRDSKIPSTKHSQSGSLDLKTPKWPLFGSDCAVLLQMTGIVILGIGIWMQVELYKYMELSADFSSTAPYVLLGTGALIVIVGSLACCCTVKGQPALLYSCGEVRVAVDIEVLRADEGEARCVCVEQRRNARTREVRDPLENPQASGIVHHDSHVGERTRRESNLVRLREKSSRATPLRSLMSENFNNLIAVVAERLGCSPPNMNRVQSPASSLPDFRIASDDAAGQRVVSGIYLRYGAFLFLIFVLELSAGVSTYAYRDKLQAGFDRGLNQTINNYDPASAKGIDFNFMQKTFVGIGEYLPSPAVIWAHASQNVGAAEAGSPEKGEERVIEEKGGHSTRLKPPAVTRGLIAHWDTGSQYGDWREGVQAEDGPEPTDVHKFYIFLRVTTVQLWPWRRHYLMENGGMVPVRDSPWVFEGPCRRMAECLKGLYPAVGEAWAERAPATRGHGCPQREAGEDLHDVKSSCSPPCCHGDSAQLGADQYRPARTATPRMLLALNSPFECPIRLPFRHCQPKSKSEMARSAKCQDEIGPSGVYCRRTRSFLLLVLTLALSSGPTTPGVWVGAATRNGIIYRLFTVKPLIYEKNDMKAPKTSVVFILDNGEVMWVVRHRVMKRAELSSFKEAVEFTCSGYWDMPMAMCATDDQAPYVSAMGRDNFEHLLRRLEVLLEVLYADAVTLLSYLYVKWASGFMVVIDDRGGN